MLAKIIILLSFLFAIGCASQPKLSLDNPQYDADGNLITPPETEAVFSLPDTHAGFAYFPKTERLTPIVSVEVIERPIPYIRNVAVNVGAGSNTIYVGVNKVWTDIFEIQTGILVGYDLEENECVVGFDITIIKF
jgi:hypothetical protein